MRWRVAEIADLPPWDIEKLVHAMDANGDGRIDLPEIDIHLWVYEMHLTSSSLNTSRTKQQQNLVTQRSDFGSNEEQVEESEEHPESEDADEVEHVEENVEDKADETAADYSISDLNKNEEGRISRTCYLVRNRYKWN